MKIIPWPLSLRYWVISLVTGDEVGEDNGRCMRRLKREEKLST